MIGKNALNSLTSAAKFGLPWFLMRQWIRNYIIVFISLFFIAGCSLNEQVDQLKALKNCSYSLVSADSVYLAGTDVSKMIGSRGLDILRAPSLAFAFLQQKVPFKARLTMRVINPGTETAGINEFDYRIVIKDVELAKGVFDRKVTIDPQGGTADVPIYIDTDLYPVISNQANQKAVSQFLSTDSVRTAIITLKIKPSFVVGKEKVSYPGYIDIDREISNKELLRFVNTR